MRRTIGFQFTALRLRNITHSITQNTDFRRTTLYFLWLLMIYSNKSLNCAQKQKHRTNNQ